MKTEAWQRSHALLMASYLPANVEDARIVLELLRELVEGFLAASNRRTAPNALTS
jgi:hypothetical protein